MTKTSIVCIAGILFFAACTNDNSSTTGSYDNEETSAPSETKEDALKDEPVNNESENAGQSSIDTAKAYKDTVNAKGTNNSLNQKGTKLQSKATKTGTKL